MPTAASVARAAARRVSNAAFDAAEALRFPAIYSRGQYKPITTLEVSSKYL